MALTNYTSVIVKVLRYIIRHGKQILNEITNKETAYRNNTDGPE
jgi:hypothetical protein